MTRSIRRPKIAYLPVVFEAPLNFLALFHRRWLRNKYEHFITTKLPTYLNIFRVEILIEF
jgi:hypothetical protein